MLPDIVPLELAIDRTVYESLFKNSNEAGLIQNVMELQSDVSIAVRSLQQGFTPHMASVLTRTASGGKAVPKVFHNGITSAQLDIKFAIQLVRQLRLAQSLLDTLLDGHQRSARQSIADDWSVSTRRRLLKIQPLSFKLFGWNSRKRFLDPWLEKKRTLEDVVSVQAAVQREKI